jgi:hypothetical protein
VPNKYSLILVSVTFAGCTGGKSGRSADLPRSAPPPPPPALSRFSAPLEYDFTPVLRVVERAVPTHFGSLDSVKAVPGDDRRHYAFEADRGPFTAYADGNLIHLRATVAYAARGFYKPVIGPTVSGGCGGGAPESRPRLLIEVATPLTLTADWRLESRAALVTVEPASATQRDRCDVTMLHHDVTPRVIESARAGITAHLADIDRRVSNVNLRQRFTALWALLAKPIRLRPDVWLELNPVRLAIGSVSGNVHVLTIPVTLAARPAVVTMDSAPSPPLPDLPPLGRDSSMQGFHITLDGQIDYATASRAVDAALEGKALTTAGRTLTVTSAVVTAADRGRLNLALTFTGSARGMLRFIGTPVYDSTSNEIAFPDLDYELRTNDSMINAYAWLRSDALRATLRSRAHVPVAGALEQGRALLLSGLNRHVGDAMDLSARVRSVAVNGVYVTRDNIVVRAEATGRAGVAVHQR